MERLTQKERLLLAKILQSVSLEKNICMYRLAAKGIGFVKEEAETFESMKAKLVIDFSGLIDEELLDMVEKELVTKNGKPTVFMHGVEEEVDIFEIMGIELVYKVTQGGSVYNFASQSDATNLYSKLLNAQQSPFLAYSRLCEG